MSQPTPPSGSLGETARWLPGQFAFGGWPTRPTGWVRYTPLLVLGLLGTAFAYVLANNPTDQRPDLLGGCGWYAMLHTNGPTRGGTRMV